MAEAAEDAARVAGLLRESHIAIIAVDADARVTAWTGAAEAMYGWSADEMLGESLAVVWPEDGSSDDVETYRKVAAGEVSDFRVWRLRKDGSRFLAEINASPITANGEHRGALALCRDVTASLTGAANLHRVMASSDLAIIGIDDHRMIRSWGGAAEALHGWTAEEVVGLPVQMLWPDDELEPHEAAAVAVERGESTVFRAWRRRKDGSRFLAELTISPTTETDGWVGSVSVSRDVTGEHNLRQQLRAAEERFEAAFTGAALPLLLCDLEATITEANDAYGILATRVDPPATIRFLDLVEPADRPALAAALRTLATERRRAEGIDVRIAGSDRQMLNVSIAPIDQGPDAAPLALVQLFDVSEQLRIQAELAERATLDPLTGVPNRSRLESLVGGLAPGSAVALLFVDLDEFKTVNDTHGHGAGDTVLRAVADRLSHVVRESDSVVRFGGDEFVLVCPGLADPTAARQLGERALRSIAETIEVNGRSLTTSSSIGISLMRVGPDLDLEAAIAHADRAMYEAKAAGRDRVVLAAPLP